MLTVACVLRSGGVYTPEWVWALKRNLNQYLDDFEFYVLSDCSCFGRWGIRLEHTWPGWWAKLEVFRPDNFSRTSPVLYLDLDTLVTGRLDDFAAYRGQLAMVTDFYRPQFAQSGVMLWNPGPMTDALWDCFTEDPLREMTRIRDDGQWLHQTTVRNHILPDRLQDLFPGQVVSYKAHATLGVPPNARLVCFHGKPKQHDPASGWAYTRWQALTADLHDDAPTR